MVTGPFRALLRAVAKDIDRHGLNRPGRAAAGDLDGDGDAEIVTAPAAGGGPHVKVFDGRTSGERLAFFALDPGFTGGLTVSTADFDSDGAEDLVVGTGPGVGSRVRVFGGRSGDLLATLDGFGLGFTGGVFVG